VKTALGRVGRNCPSGKRTILGISILIIVQTLTQIKDGKKIKCGSGYFKNMNKKKVQGNKIPKGRG